MSGHWLVWEKKVASVTVLARRGPAERAYTDKEMREVVNAVDFDALDKEVNRVAPILESIGQDVAAVKEELRKPLDGDLQFRVERAINRLAHRPLRGRLAKRLRAPGQEIHARRAGALFASYVCQRLGQCIHQF